MIMGRIYDPKRKLAVLNAMRNLSDVATSLNTVGGLVADLVQLVEVNIKPNLSFKLAFYQLYSCHRLTQMLVGKRG